MTRGDKNGQGWVGRMATLRSLLALGKENGRFPFAASRSGRRRQLEADDAGDDQGNAEQPGGIGRLAKQHDAEDHRADRADSNPYAVGGADRQRLHGDAQQPQADDHRRGGAERWPQAGKAGRVLEPDGPANLEQSGKNQNHPSHMPSFDICGVVPGWGWSGGIATVRDNHPVTRSRQGVQQPALALNFPPLSLPCAAAFPSCPTLS